MLKVAQFILKLSEAAFEKFCAFLTPDILSQKANIPIEMAQKVLTMPDKKAMGNVIRYLLSNPSNNTNLIPEKLTKLISSESEKQEMNKPTPEELRIADKYSMSGEYRSWVIKELIKLRTSNPQVYNTLLHPIAFNDYYPLNKILLWFSTVRPNIGALSYEEAFKATTDWIKDPEQKGRAKPLKYEDDDSNIIATLPVESRGHKVNWTLRNVTSTSCKIEGELMEHCVGAYDYILKDKNIIDDIKNWNNVNKEEYYNSSRTPASYVLSLRDEFNRPHATIELSEILAKEYPDKIFKITQLYGYKNNPLNEKYKNLVFKGLKEAGIKVLHAGVIPLKDVISLVVVSPDSSTRNIEIKIKEYLDSSMVDCDTEEADKKLQSAIDTVKKYNVKNGLNYILLQVDSFIRSFKDMFTDDDLKRLAESLYEFLKTKDKNFINTISLSSYNIIHNSENLVNLLAKSLNLDKIITFLAECGWYSNYYIIAGHLKNIHKKSLKALTLGGWNGIIITSHLPRVGRVRRPLIGRPLPCTLRTLSAVF